MPSVTPLWARKSRRPLLLLLSEWLRWAAQKHEQRLRLRHAGMRFLLRKRSGGNVNSLNNCGGSDGP
jgi:hypothetical protein